MTISTLGRAAAVEPTPNNRRAIGARSFDMARLDRIRPAVLRRVGRKYNRQYSHPKGPAVHADRLVVGFSTLSMAWAQKAKGITVHADRLVAVRELHPVAPEVPDHDPRPPGRRRPRVGGRPRLRTAAAG